ncbi:hypothetical protein ACFSTI_23195 [Rhizorhabdus histidinilytica]
MKREISFNDPDIQRCPFAAYREIREQGPVYYDKSNGFYIVTGYEDIRKAASDPKTFSSVTGQLLVKTAPIRSGSMRSTGRRAICPSPRSSSPIRPSTASTARWSTRSSPCRPSSGWRNIWRAWSTRWSTRSSIAARPILL